MRDGPRRDRGGGFLQLRAALGESRLRESKEDQAENRRRILRRRKAGVGAKLIRRLPQPLFERLICSVFFRRCDPLHCGYLLTSTAQPAWVTIGRSMFFRALSFGVGISILLKTPRLCRANRGAGSKLAEIAGSLATWWDSDKDEISKG